MSHTSSNSVGKVQQGNQPVTLADYFSQLIETFTGDGWSVTSLQVEKNAHTDETDTQVLEGSLSHTSGSLIQLIPFDREEHKRETPQYESNRVRVRDRIQERAVYYASFESRTIDPWDPQQLTPESFTLPDSHPFPDAKTLVTTHDQEQVHERDSRVSLGGDTEEDKRGFVLPTTELTLIAVFAATNQVSQQTTDQSELGSFTGGA